MCKRSRFLCLFLLSSLLAENVLAETVTERTVIRSCPVECSCKTKTRLDCSNRRLREIPKDIQSGQTQLDLQGNLIAGLGVESFLNFSSLKFLDLSGNMLESISSEVFHSLQGLQTLLIKRNALKAIPAAVQKLSSLTRLELRGNRIKSLSDADWVNIKQITTVDLSRNLISELPVPVRDHVDGPSNIQLLDLSANELESLPPRVFSSFSSLRILRLSRNRLTSIDRDSFAGLEGLEELDLSRNPSLTSLPALVFSGAPSLLTVTLARCGIQSLEDGVFHGASQLHSLNFSSNALTELKEGWLFGLHSLYVIDLSKNSLTAVSVATWAQIGALRNLSLAGNRFRSLPSGAFRTLRQLEQLSLASNALESLHKTAMAGLDNLRNLDVSSNSLAVCVEDGAVLQGTLPNLTDLNFANNQLRQIPARAFERFSSLERLDLSDNLVTSMAEDAFEPLRLKQLRLNSSSLLCDCHLAWFAPWLAGSGISRSSIELRCAHPSPLADIPLLAIDTTNLTCSDSSPRPRILTQPPASLRAVTGGRADIECRAGGAAPLSILWKLIVDGRARELDEDSTTTINTTVVEEHDGEESSTVLLSRLQLNDVTLDDRAEYQCVARNRFGVDYSSRVALDVQQPPRLTREPDDVSLLVGHNVRVSCAATGVPRPIVRWHKDSGDSFPAATERRLYIRSGEDDLYLMAVTKADAGVYTCVASNDAGTVQASATLRVYDNGFREPSESSTVQVGATAVLDCSCDVQSGQRIEWQHEGEKLEGAARVDTERSTLAPEDAGLPGTEGSQLVSQPMLTRKSLRANDQILIILSTTPADAGVYSCELWAGGDRLARRILQLNVEDDLGIHQGKIPAASLSWIPHDDFEGAQAMSTAQKIAIIVLSAILASLLCGQFVWLLFSFRRNALAINGEYTMGRRVCEDANHDASP